MRVIFIIVIHMYFWIYILCVHIYTNINVLWMCYLYIVYPGLYIILQKAQIILFLIYFKYIEKGNFWAFRERLNKYVEFFSYFYVKLILRRQLNEKYHWDKEVFRSDPPITLNKGHRRKLTRCASVEDYSNVLCFRPL